MRLQLALLALCLAACSGLTGCGRWNEYARRDFLRDAEPSAAEAAEPVARVDGNVRVSRRDGQRETLRGPVDLTEHGGALWVRGSDGDTVAIPFEEVASVETRGADGPAIAALVAGALLAAAGIVAASIFLIDQLNDDLGVALFVF